MFQIKIEVTNSRDTPPVSSLTAAHNASMNLSLESRGDTPKVNNRADKQSNSNSNSNSNINSSSSSNSNNHQVNDASTMLQLLKSQARKNKTHDNIYNLGDSSDPDDKPGLPDQHGSSFTRKQYMNMSPVQPNSNNGESDPEPKPSNPARNIRTAPTTNINTTHHTIKPSNNFMR